MAVSPISAGVRCRCPNCGEGRVFNGYLKLTDKCEVCGADFTVADVGDGASFFVMWAALIVVAPAAMVFELLVSPPAWVHAIVWPPVVVGVCLVLLRPFKATLFALQWKHKAGQAKFEE